MLRTVVASAVVASAAAFSAPSAFTGMGLNTQAATRSCGMTMSAETEGVSRRAALGAFLAGAAAIPGDKSTANAEVMSSFGKNGDGDPNKQLRIGGVGMTSVQGTGQTGIRTSGFGKAILGNAKNAQSFPRDGMTPEQIGAVEKLTNNVMANSAIDKSGVATFSGKLGINPGFGGSSGIMTGAK